MREIRTGITNVDEYREAGLRAKQHVDTDRWRRELRPRELRRFAARARRLTWSRALLNAISEELYPDPLFAELVGPIESIPRRHWPWVLAIAVALRRSWRRDGLAHLAERLGVPPFDDGSGERGTSAHPSRPSRKPCCGSARRRQGSSLRCDPAPRGLRP
jgi:hypothetical protein